MPRIILPSRISNIGAWLLTFAPAIALAVFVWQFSTNAPYGDDYDSILGIIPRLSSAHTLREFFDYLVVQHNEHRIIFVRLIAYLYTKISGIINFKGIITLGFAQIILLFALLATIQTQKFNIRTLWPISLLLFQPSYHETILWATTTWSNITVMVLAVAALSILLGKQQNLIAGGALAVLATYSQANGIFVFAAGAAGLTAQHRYRHLTLWLALAAAISFAFFHDYQKPPNHPAIDISLHGIRNDIQFFVVFLGGVFKIQNTATIVGVVIICCIMFLAKFLWQKQPLLGSLIFFLLLTAGSAALGRSPFGIKSALMSRYTICSAVLLIALYLAFWERFPQRKTLVIFGMLSIYLALFQWHRSKDQSDYIELLAAQAKIGDYCYQNIVYPEKNRRHAVEILKIAEDEGIFFLRTQPQADTDATLICLQNSNNQKL